MGRESYGEKAACHVITIGESPFIVGPGAQAIRRGIASRGQTLVVAFIQRTCGRAEQAISKVSQTNGQWCSRPIVRGIHCVEDAAKPNICRGKRRSSPSPRRGTLFAICRDERRRETKERRRGGSKRRRKGNFRTESAKIPPKLQWRARRPAEGGNRCAPRNIGCRDPLSAELKGLTRSSLPRLSSGSVMEIPRKQGNAARRDRSEVRCLWSEARLTVRAMRRLNVSRQGPREKIKKLVDIEACAIYMEGVRVARRGQ